MNEIRIFIYWDDLSKEKQEKILKVFGDNCNWDVHPLAVVTVENEDTNFPSQNIDI